MSVDYAPSLVAIVFGIAFALFFLGLAMFLGPKRSDPEKMAPFECGSEPIGSPRRELSDIGWEHSRARCKTMRAETSRLSPSPGRVEGTLHGAWTASSGPT